MKLRLDPEFKDYLGPLDKEARQALEESLLVEGCRDALVVWPQSDGDPILLDGHNRHAICEQHGISFRTVNCPDSVTDREDAAAWIVENQRGRRNITSERMAYITAKVYSAIKEERGGDRKSEAQKSKVQNEPLIFGKDAATRVAEKFGASRSKIKRNVKFAEAVDAIVAKHGPDVREDILEGRKKMSDFMPEPEPESLNEEETPLEHVSESKTPSTPPAGGLPAADSTREEEESAVPKPEIAAEPASALGEKLPVKERQMMTDSECIQWMAKNLTFLGDSGLRPGPVHIADAATDNLVDPEAVRRYDNSSMFHLCQLEYHIALFPSAVERDAPDAERREMLKKRMARQVDALQTIVVAL